MRPINIKHESRKRVLRANSPMELIQQMKEVGAPFDKTSEYFGGVTLRTWEEAEQQMTQLPILDALPRTVQMIEKLKDAIQSKPQKITRATTFRDDDGAFDYDRYDAGEEKPFIAPRKRKRTSSRNVMVTMNGAGLATVSDTVLSYRSVALVTTVDLLENAGYSCEVALHWNSEETYTKGMERGSLTIIKLKEAGDAFSVTDSLNSFSSWFFRGCIFGTRLYIGDVLDRYACSSGMGRSAFLSESLYSLFDPPKNAQFLNIEIPTNQSEIESCVTRAIARVDKFDDDMGN